jgi:hypothetical protein
MVHCAAPNRGVRPRFMRIKQQFLSHEGRELLRRPERRCLYLPGAVRSAASAPCIRPPVRW